MTQLGGDASKPVNCIKLHADLLIPLILSPFYSPLQMRSFQILSSVCSRLQSGALSESSTGAVALAVCAGYWQNCCSSREFWSTAAASRFRASTAEPRRPDGVIESPPQADLVDKFLSLELMCSHDQRQERIRAAMSRFERFPGDTGSSEVQVAILTEKIYAMAEHMKVHRKDFSSRNGLRGMLAQRRKLLQYLRRSNFDAYSKMLSSLGLKDTYAKQDRLAIRRTRGIETVEV